MNSFLKVMLVLLISFSAQALPMPGNSDAQRLEGLPSTIQEVVLGFDSAGFYLADGYYDQESKAYYALKANGEVVAYMVAEVLSYTQSDEYYLTGMVFSLDGDLLTNLEDFDELVLNIFSSKEEVNQFLPEELWID